MLDTTCFCMGCRKYVDYTTEKVKEEYTINGKKYNFCITKAYCNRCGEEVDVHGLLDLNSKEITDQYRQIEGIITIKEILELINKSNMTDTELSLKLGFNESTISKYLEGKVPSKKYSDIMLEELVKLRKEQEMC